jgi:hypothetical protein
MPTLAPIRHIVALDLVGQGQRLDDRPRQIAQHLGFRSRRDDHGELVAAQAGHQADVADAVAQAFGHFDQQGVANRMAQAVVDALEVVEIQAQHGAAACSPLR